MSHVRFFKILLCAIVQSCWRSFRHLKIRYIVDVEGYRSTNCFNFVSSFFLFYKCRSKRMDFVILIAFHWGGAGRDGKVISLVTLSCSSFLGCVTRNSSSILRAPLHLSSFIFFLDPSMGYFLSDQPKLFLTLLSKKDFFYV